MFYSGVDTKNITLMDLEAEDNYQVRSLALAANGDHEQALETLLGAVSRDPTWNDGAARKAMLDLFGVLGRDNPLTRTYRSRLSSALF